MNSRHLPQLFTSKICSKTSRRTVKIAEEALITVFLKVIYKFGVKSFHTGVVRKDPGTESETPGFKITSPPPPRRLSGTVTPLEFPCRTYLF